MPIDDIEAAAIRANLFYRAHPLIGESPDFPWHRDRSKQVTAALKESSQALALDLFATVQRLPSRNRIVNRWAENFGLGVSDEWELIPEYCIPREMLGEPRPTQLDVLAKGNRGLILFECKFTEPDGGSCSQPRPIQVGANQGKRQCNGNYEMQANPIDGRRAKCALVPKGVRYWDHAAEVMDVDASRDYRPCPFAGGWYQWMRNLVSTLSLGRAHGLPAVFAVAFADGPFPMARKVHGPEWKALNAAVEGRAVRMQATSYQQLLVLARDAAAPGDNEVLAELASWMDGKIEEVGRRLQTPREVDR